MAKVYYTTLTDGTHIAASNLLPDDVEDAPSIAAQEVRVVAGYKNLLVASVASGVNVVAPGDILTIDEHSIVTAAAAETVHPTDTSMPGIAPSSTLRRWRLVSEGRRLLFEAFGRAMEEMAIVRTLSWMDTLQGVQRTLNNNLVSAGSDDTINWWGRLGDDYNSVDRYSYLRSGDVAQTANTPHWFENQRTRAEICATVYVIPWFRWALSLAAEDLVGTNSLQVGICHREFCLDAGVLAFHRRAELTSAGGWRNLRDGKTLARLDMTTGLPDTSVNRSVPTLGAQVPNDVNDDTFFRLWKEFYDARIGIFE